MYNNKFIVALEKKEVDKFILGENDYFQRGSEETRGRHSISSAWQDIMNYNKENDSEDIIFKLIDASLIKVLHTHIGAWDLLDVIMIIWCYYIDKEDKIIRKIGFSLKN